MSMLGRKKPDEGKLDTLIGQGTEIEGVLRSTGSIRIEGTFSGKLETQGDITIGEQALAKSDMQARHVWIAGQVIGNVQTSGTLSILQGGSLRGDVSCHALVIEEGAFFEGKSHMLQEAAATKEQKAKTQ
ncbi:bactofilin family protein [Xylanibacillus composti]|nr:polymer-forming cytoskeletal protein [Xylanibacillus composti]